MRSAQTACRHRRQRHLVVSRRAASSSASSSTRVPALHRHAAKGAVPDDHPLCFGYPDPTLNRAAKQAFAEADLFVIIGKRIDYRLALGGPKLLRRMRA